MIGNVLKLVQVVKDQHRMGHGLGGMIKYHPLGVFEGMDLMLAASSVEEMYEMVLVDSPIGPFFTKTDRRDFDEFSTDYIRALLQKNYLEAFYDYVQSLGGVTAETMGEILEFEADRAVLTITRQSYNSKSLSKDERKNLYPNFGQLVDVQDELCDVDDEEKFKSIIRPYATYYRMLEQLSSGGSSSSGGFGSGGTAYLEPLLKK
jgi:V-type H+-transporting ATPase subunit d